MKRIFHARITWYQYIYLIILGLLTFWLLWEKMIILTLLCMLLLVGLIERFIHTTYTLTADCKLVIYTGRFAKEKTIPLQEVSLVERRQFPLGKLTRTGYVLLQYGSRYISLLPLKEQEFIDLLEKRRNECLTIK